MFAALMKYSACLLAQPFLDPSFPELLGRIPELQVPRLPVPPMASSSKPQQPATPPPSIAVLAMVEDELPALKERERAEATVKAEHAKAVAGEHRARTQGGLDKD